MLVYGRSSNIDCCFSSKLFARICFFRRTLMDDTLVRKESTAWWSILNFFISGIGEGMRGTWFTDDRGVHRRLWTTGDKLNLFGFVQEYRKVGLLHCGINLTDGLTISFSWQGQMTLYWLPLKDFFRRRLALFGLFNGLFFGSGGCDGGVFEELLRIVLFHRVI